MCRKEFDKVVLKEIWEELKKICNSLNLKTEITEEDKEAIAKKADIVLERYEELVIDSEVISILEHIITLVDTDPRAEKLAEYINLSS